MLTKCPSVGYGISEPNTFPKSSYKLSKVFNPIVSGVKGRATTTKKRDTTDELKILDSASAVKITPARRKYVKHPVHWLPRVHKKCSTKWMPYRGCIPYILKALENTRDVEEALKPWENSLRAKEGSIILKEQALWERALSIFEWFKKNRKDSLNVIHYNIIFRILGKAEKWSHMESMWSDMKDQGIAPSNSTFGTLIDVYSKGGRREEALLWLEKMRDMKLQPDGITTGTVMQMYKQAGEFEKMKSFLRETKEESSPSRSYTYNMLIDMYGKAGDVREVSRTFEGMISQGILPTTVTFNSMIHAFGNHGDLEEVSLLLHKMQTRGCLPDTRTYNILISLYAKHDDISSAEGYFKEMKKAKLEPDLVTFRTLLYAYTLRKMASSVEELVSEMDQKFLEIDEYTQSAITRMYIDSTMLEKSWHWFATFHSKGTMTPECYAATIDAYAERGHAFYSSKVFSCCKEAKRLSVTVFNVMIKAYGFAKEYDKACQVFDEMTSHNVVPDKCSFGSLIQILAGGGLPEKARPYLKRMQEETRVDDCVSHCSVISAFVKIGKVEKAEEIYKDMIACEITPDIVVYSVMINAYADIGSVRALELVDALKKSGMEGNPYVFTALIKLYTKIGYTKEAKEVYQTLVSMQGLDAYSSNCMIDLYSRQSLVGEAEEVFSNLKRDSMANEFSYAMMLCMYRRMGWFDQALIVAKEMRELGLMSDVLTYNNALALYASAGRYKDAVDIFEEIVASYVVLDDYTFKSLGIMLVKCGVSRKAVSKLEEKRRRDYQAGLVAWRTAVRSVYDFDSIDFDEFL